eukprot:TRINITY_DN1611_c0_g1_i8.p1 TRINITY_DN1611_c0_g1~~TRINITY_DN1611_c0_g1_i8.p1  ORF type:complete len:130 (+),score=36.39 TRINITY_DN1611_c0_g1_i8:522-911(+)
MPVNFKKDGWVMDPRAVEAVQKLYVYLIETTWPMRYYTYSYPALALSLSLSSLSSYPNFEPRDDTRKVRTVSEMVDRVDELERLVEKLVLEKEDAYTVRLSLSLSLSLSLLRWLGTSLVHTDPDFSPGL